MTATTHTTTIDKLTVGDQVIAMNGKPTAFAQEVTQVLNQTHTFGRKAMILTRVDFAHGGVIAWVDASTAVATVAGA